MGEKRKKAAKPVEESEDAVAPSRDFDAEQKDAEVMREEEESGGQSPKEDDIPPANADKLWRHLSPKNVMAADAELVLRASVLFMALKGYGVSQNLWERMPKDVQSLFNGELLENEAWVPADNF